MTRHPGSRPRLLLADDHALVAEGLRSMLAPKFDVVGVVEDGRTLVQVAEELKPDVILVDISMPQLNGIEAARRLKKALPKTKLIFVTMHEDATFVTEALRAGASGYVVKKAAPQELVAAIQEVLRGRTYVTSLVTKGLVDTLLAHRPPAGTFGRLTPRQREVLQLVAEGRSIKEIAGILNLSPRTVEFHKCALVRALGVRTTAELTAYAIRHGIAAG